MALPLQHLEEQVSASTSAMLFFAGDHVAGTHGAAIQASALAHADAAQCSSSQAALIVGKFEVCFGLSGVVGGAEAQVFVEEIGVDNLAGIHLAMRVPEGL